MSLKNVLHAALYSYKKYILLIPDTEDQAAGFLNAVKNGYILFRWDQTLLLRQLQEFPLGTHDDGPDALEGSRALARRQVRIAALAGLRV